MNFQKDILNDGFNLCLGSLEVAMTAHTQAAFPVSYQGKGLMAIETYYNVVESRFDMSDAGLMDILLGKLV